MLEVQATARGLANLEKLLKVESARHKKALDTSLRVRGFKLAAQMRREIRAGAPGGKKFAPLTYLARYWGRGRGMRANRPLAALAKAVRYHVPRKDPFEVSVGFTHPMLGRTWPMIAALQQEGFTSTTADRRRDYWIHLASRMSKRRAGRRYLFIKKSTKRFKTPARPIVAPFWTAHRQEAMDKIRRDFRAKLAGKRV